MADDRRHPLSARHVFDASRLNLGERDNASRSSAILVAAFERHAVGFEALAHSRRYALLVAGIELMRLPAEGARSLTGPVNDAQAERLIRALCELRVAFAACVEAGRERNTTHRRNLASDALWMLADCKPPLDEEAIARWITAAAAVTGLAEPAPSIFIDTPTIEPKKVTRPPNRVFQRLVQLLAEVCDHSTFPVRTPNGWLSAGFTALVEDCQSILPDEFRAPIGEGRKQLAGRIRSALSEEDRESPVEG